MLSIRPRWKFVVAIIWISSLCAGEKASLLAQPSLFDAPPIWIDSADAEHAPATDLRVEPPVNSVLDREAVQKIVREELEANKVQAPSDPESKSDTKSTDVSIDRTLLTRWDNGFVAETADKSFRVHVGGRLEFDNNWFNQDDNILIGLTPEQRMLDGTLFRRARFRTDGRLYENIDFACEVNFANIQDVSNVDASTVQVGSVGLTDFYVTFREFPWFGNVRLGHVQAPISLERYTSSNAWYFMERSSMYDAFYNPNDYQNGVVAFDSYFDDRVTLAGSAAWVGKADIQSFGFGANEGKYGVGARVTALPMYECEGYTLMHVGAGYFRQALVDDLFSVASRPLLRAGAGGSQTPNLVFTGTFFTPSDPEIANVEAAYVHGPFSLSGEFALTNVRNVFAQSAPLAEPRGDVTYQAGYVETGLFVTPGDQRRYDKKTGTWARTIPVEDACVLNRSAGRDGHGAVQLVGRYTFLDLVSGDPVLTPTSGGARAGLQHDVTLGVNWYLNSQTWFMVNYVATRIDSVVPGASGDIHGAGCRLHLDF